jgi:hypothetical protein
LRISHPAISVLIACGGALLATSPTAMAQAKPPAGRLTVDQLCAKLTLEEVQAIMGRDFQRREKSEALFLECKYGHKTEKGRTLVQYFSLGSYFKNSTEASWRKQIEGNGKGKVKERDGVLVGDRVGNGFGTLDTIWFKDRSGHPLYLTVNAGVTEDQAVALAKAAMN